MSRIVRKPITLFSFSFAILIVPIWLWFRPSPIVPMPPEPVLAAPMVATLPQLPNGQPLEHPAQFNVLLTRAGLSPDALAAAGVSELSVSTIVSSALTSVQAHPQVLATLDMSFAEARRESDERRRRIQSGLGTEADVTIYQASSAAMNSAEAQRETFLTELLATATANLPPEQRTALVAIRANSTWNLPKQYMVVNRTQEQWVALRDALANERIAAKLGEEPDPACQALLATCRANSAVIAGTSGVAPENLAAIRSAWNTAAGND